jgi:hypothetical protein
VSDPVLAPAPAAAVRPFSRATAVVYLLGILALAAVAAAPFLPSRSYSVVGTKPERLNFPTNPRLVKPAVVPYAAGLPAGVALLAAVGLVAALRARHFGPLALLAGYAGLLAAGLLLLAAGLCLRLHQGEIGGFTNIVGYGGITGANIRGSLGPDIWVALGGSAAAALCFLAAVVAVHRSAGPRVLVTVVAVVLLFMGAFLVLTADYSLIPDALLPATS